MKFKHAFLKFKQFFFQFNRIALTALLCIFLYSQGFSLCVNSIDGEKKDSTLVPEKYRKFKIGLDYSSVNTFNGRKDTSKIPILSPNLKYTGKRGFFTELDLVNVPKGKKLFDELDANIGWLFDLSENWDAGLSFSHYFYDAKVARIKASVSNHINLNGGYDWDILYSSLDLNWDGGNNKFPFKGKIITQKTNDFSLNFSNSHVFSFDDLLAKDDRFYITPEADVLCGTQNFLVKYKGKINTADKVYQQQASKFNLTGYLLSLEIKYKIKKFTLELTPTYIIPKNVPPGDSSTPYFVMNASIYFTLKKKAK